MEQTPRQGKWRTEVEITDQKIRDGRWCLARNKHTNERVGLYMAPDVMYHYIDDDLLFDRHGDEIQIVEDVPISPATPSTTDVAPFIHKKLPTTNTKPGKFTKDTFKRMRGVFPEKYELKITMDEILKFHGLWEHGYGPRGARMKRSTATISNKKAFLKLLLDNSCDGIIYGSVGDLRTKVYSGEIYYDKNTKEAIFIHHYPKFSQEKEKVEFTYGIGPLGVFIPEKKRVRTGTAAVVKLLEMAGKPVPQKSRKYKGYTFRAHPVDFWFLKNCTSPMVKAAPWNLCKEWMSLKGQEAPNKIRKQSHGKEEEEVEVTDISEDVSGDEESDDDDSIDNNNNRHQGDDEDEIFDSDTEQHVGLGNLNLNAVPTSNSEDLKEEFRQIINNVVPESVQKIYDQTSHIFHLVEKKQAHQEYMKRKYVDADDDVSKN